MAKRYDRLSLHLFKLFQAPFLRAAFAWNGKSRKWQLQNIAPLAASEIPADHRSFVVEVAKEYFAGRRRGIPKKTSPRFDLAILVDPREAGAAFRRQGPAAVHPGR